MIRRSTPALATALLLAAAARADSLLDRPAPDPAVTKWVVGEPPPSWKALKGRCALLELTDPDDIVSQGLASRTAELAARGASKKLLVVTVAVGTAVNEGTAKAFADTFKITWPLGVDRKGETFVAAGLPTLPRHFLIAPDGRVLWEGSPGALDNATLDGFLDRARLWRPEEVAKMLRPAAELFVKGSYGAASKKVAEILAVVKKRQMATLPLEGTEEKDARLVLDAVQSMALIRLGIAAGLAKERWSIDAQEIYEGVAAAFAGSEWEGRAKEGLAAMAADKRAQYEITAMKRVREILAGIRPLTRQTLQHAIEEIDNLLQTYENTVSGERARGEKARLQKLLQGL